MHQSSQSIRRVNQSDNSMAYLIVGFILLMILGFLTQRYTNIFYEGWKIIFFPLVKVIDVLSNSFFGDLINPILSTTKMQSHDLNLFISQTPVENWNVQVFIAMNHFIGKYLLIIFVPAGTYMIISIFKLSQQIGGAYHHFNNSHLLNSYILSSDNKNISNAAVEDSDFKEEYSGALSCAQFCEKNHLISLNKDKTSVNDIDVELSFQVFSHQLGDKLTRYLNVFDMSYGWVVNRILEYIPIAHRLEAFDYSSEGHLYIATVILSLLSTARRFGVVPIQPFLYLKTQNRALWYAIASVGRKVAFVEGAGIIAQFNYENSRKQESNELEKNIIIPEQVESAVNGLMQGLIEESLELNSNDNQSIWDYFDSRAS